MDGGRVQRNTARSHPSKFLLTLRDYLNFQSVQYDFFNRQNIVKQPTDQLVTKSNIIWYFISAKWKYDQPSD